jgi:hypothetical protein
MGEAKRKRDEVERRRQMFRQVEKAFPPPRSWVLVGEYTCKVCGRCEALFLGDNASPDEWACSESLVDCGVCEGCLCDEDEA